jgi:hypothetical protein
MNVVKSMIEVLVALVVKFGHVAVAVDGRRSCEGI